MNWLCSLLLPVIYGVLGLIFWRRPPRRINYTAGWRSKAAMRNEDSWRFANRYGGRCFLLTGLAELTVTVIILCLLIPCQQQAGGAATLALVALQCLSLIPLYRYVEKAVKDHGKK